MKDGSQGQTGKYKQPYTPSLTGRNPEKTKETDWWDELCKKHRAKNYWKNEKKKSHSSEEEGQKKLDK